MTTSTAPITLPARHRSEQAPTWWFHTLLARTAADVRTIDQARGRRHIAVLALAVALIVAAPLLLIALA